MKKVLGLFLALFTTANLFAQNKELDSLKLLLSKEKTDTGKVNLLISMGGQFGFGGSENKTTSLGYLQQALDLSKKINYQKGVISAQARITYTLIATGNYPEALDLALKNLKMANELRDSGIIFSQTRAITWIYYRIGDPKSGLTYAKKLISLSYSGAYRDPVTMTILRAMANENLGNGYYVLKQFDSALYHLATAYEYALKNKDPEMLAVIGYSLGNTYATIGKTDSAFYFFRLVNDYSQNAGRLDYTGRARLQIATLFNKTEQPDSALFYGRQALEAIRNTYAADVTLEADSLLSGLYGIRHQYDSAYKFLQSFVMLNDSLNNQDKITKAQNLSFNETLQQQQVEQAKKDAQQQYKNRLKIYFLAAVILIFLIIALLQFRNNQNKRKANLVLSKQKEEIEEQKKNVEATLSELKSTQKQLIQSEKMASLGELTAGIAHEIQNPLNFVNNFSDINKELVDEAEEEIVKGNYEEVKNILNDVKENSDKINHHGKRADAIVKGMLQHSRSSTGVKEPTDINALCDEYLRLSYHGMRAKDKSFNAEMKTDFDETLPKINIVPQDIGRVLLNLINNAFYAVHEKNTLRQAQGDSYNPTVSVTTKKTDNHVTITVNDNGNGIPGNIKDKIFQPFFTTKPTGEGTGLGLSLSYDMVKAHGGELKVESKVAEGNSGKSGKNEGTEFIIQLPIN